MNSENSKLIIETLTQVVVGLTEAIETDSTTLFIETIEHEGKQYSRKTSREEFLQESIEEAIQKIEDINCGHIEEV